MVPDIVKVVPVVGVVVGGGGESDELDNAANGLHADSDNASSNAMNPFNESCINRMLFFP